MKYAKLPAITFLVIFLITVTCKAQSADEIVANYINAIGGIDNWKKVNSIFYEGKLTVHGTDVTIYKTVLHGKGMRQNMTTASMTAFQISTPNEGWEFMPFRGQQKPEQLGEGAVKLNADQYDAQGVLVDYKSKGHSIEYLGKETIDGKECYKLQVKHKSGKIEILYFDASSSLMVRSVVKQNENGKEVDVITKLSNYQKQPEGILYPMTIGLPMGEMNITKVNVNKPVNESIFKPVN